mmetsp:Transcript_88331/g.175612  ORF Transcript_88331/g.175612 Transcript_88331/m.175612 type:complete len:865 (-) Transcript_88331:52-2646(-)
MSTTAFEELLLACLCGQAQEAELRLAEAESQDTVQYLQSCARLLCSQAQPRVRQLAGLLLKNFIGAAQEGGRSRRLVQRWHGLTAEVRDMVKGAALQALADQDPGVRRTGALCVARAAAIDADGDLLTKSLLDMVRANQNSAMVAESIRALGFLAEEWSARGFNGSSEAEHLQSLALAGLKQGQGVVRVASAQALLAVLPCTAPARLQRNNPSELLSVLETVLEACSEETLRSEALQLLAHSAQESYQHLAQEHLRKMLDVSLDVQALALWEALAAFELQILTCRREASKEIMQHVMPLLLPSLLAALETQPPDLEQDAWLEETMPMLQEAARACLASVAKVVASACVQQVLQFVESRLASGFTWKRRAALLAFGAIQEGPPNQAMQPLISAALPRLLDSLKATIAIEASAAAWTLGRILDVNPISVPEAVQASLFEVVVIRLAKEPGLAEELCYCLDGLVDQQAALLEPRLFGPVVESLLQGASSAHGRAKLALLRSLAELFGRGGEDCVPCMAPCLSRILHAAEADLALGRVPDSAVMSCMRALIYRLGRDGLAASDTDTLLAFLIRCLQAQHSHNKTFDEESLRALGTLAMTLGESFNADMSAIGPILLSALQTQEQPEACLAAISTLSDLSKAMGSKLLPFSPSLLDALAAAFLQQGTECTPLEQKLCLKAVQGFGDILLAFGADTPKISTLLEILRQQAESSGHSQLSSEVYLAALPIVASDGSVSLVPISGAKTTLKKSCPVNEDFCKRMLEAVLDAYASLLQACQRSGTSTASAFGNTLPFALSLAFKLTLENSPSSMRLALKFVSGLAAEMPKELRAYTASISQAAACISKLVTFGTLSPKKSAREAARTLARALA